VYQRWLTSKTCCYKKAHCTILGFTEVNGEPLMCVIIYAQKWALGFDPFVDWIGSEEAKILEKGRIASGS